MCGIELCSPLHSRLQFQGCVANSSAVAFAWSGSCSCSPQCVNVKFCVRIGKSTTETYDLLKKVYGDECLFHSQVFQWFQRSKEGREEIRDSQRPSHPSTSKTDANFEKVGDSVRQNWRLSIWAVAELVNINKETVRQILHNNFNINKCSKMVPRLLTPERKKGSGRGVHWGWQHSHCVIFLNKQYSNISLVNLYPHHINKITCHMWAVTDLIFLC
jgi:hypothetical protein